MVIPLEVVADTGLAALQLAPLTPVIDQVPLPVGAGTPAVPTTVAVKVKVSPKLALADDVEIETFGAILEIVTVAAALKPVER